MSRNILNNNDDTGRNIINRKIRSFANTAIEPVEITDVTSTSSTIGLKGLTGFTANKILKVNSAGDALEYADETDTVYTAQSPLLLTGTIFSLSQAAFNITGSITDSDYVPFFDTNGNFDRITALNLKSYFTGTQYSAQIPLVLSGTTFELDFSGLTDYGEENPITNTTEFVVSTDGVKVLRALTYEKLLNQIDTYVNTNLDVIASAPLVITNPFPTKTAFSYDMDSMSAITDVQVGDTILLHAGTLSAPNYLNRKMTGLQLKSYIANKGSNFGTTPSGHIDIGNTTYQTRIAGNAIYLNNASNGEIIFQGSGNFVYLYLLEDSGSLVRSNGRNIAGYFQATAKVVLGNSTDNTEIFGDDVAISGGLATGSSEGGFTRRLNIFNRGLYLYQSPWGGTGNSTVGRASWLITPGFQQFRLEFHLTATDGTLIFLSYINGVGVYVVEYSFTGQHKSKSIDDTIYDNIEDYVGLICISTGEYATYDFENETCNSGASGITINDSMPIIDLCRKRQDKRVYGVISNKEDSDREMGYGRFVSKLPSANDANRVVVNGIGEGGIWVINTNGNLENGDYIQSSNVAGYGERQDDDLVHNYTVAKITCSCDFDMGSSKYKSKLVGDNIACFVGCNLLLWLSL
jgi:hypothetical protein